MTSVSGHEMLSHSEIRHSGIISFGKSSNILAVWSAAPPCWNDAAKLPCSHSFGCTKLRNITGRSYRNCFAILFKKLWAYNPKMCNIIQNSNSITVEMSFMNLFWIVWSPVAKVMFVKGK
ncbi:hypothetical protein NPIL_688621 [Nephila pilipes]|uniref:Uncharacterized protein n=1 Tax=Nephila pilipes TaxID=299642 RepID=A0A8X6PRM8_NEPPI|nr:hypothetical protein NPIL_688621 [Nephila pilipes]